MNRKLRWLSLSLVLGAMLTQFNNCGQYQEATGDNASSSSVVCDDDCVTPTTDNLQIKTNIGGGTEYQVPAGLAEFNLGGDCNEGGYAHNTIRWELQLNGVTVRNSGMLGMVAGNVPAHSKCVNGRFLIYVNMTAIAEDNVNRTGLRYSNSSTARATYDLYIEIYGQDSPNGTFQRNPLKSRQRVSLLAI